MARATFQTLLGVLRSWRTAAGELQIERLDGLGAGPVRDEGGNQWLSVGPAIAHIRMGGEIEHFAEMARDALKRSDALGNALWLNGRAGRSAADYYMIHEYACAEFVHRKGVTEALGVSGNDQERLRASANNLSPLHGGRHAQSDGPVPWNLERQREFCAGLLRRWMRYRAVAS